MPTHYRSLIGQNLWEPANDKPKESELAGMRAEIKSLRQIIEKGGKAPGEKKSNESQVTCFICDEKGHISKNCPKRGTCATNQGNNTSTTTNSGQVAKKKKWRKVPP